MKRSAPAAILLATGILAGCSTSNPLEKKLDYKSAEPPKLGNSLEVPPDLTTPQIQNKYVIPSTGTASALANSNNAAAAQQAATQPVTTETVAIKSIDNITMERAGTQRWLAVKGKSPAELWPVLKAFWQENGFVIKTEEPDLGIMETDWAENRAKLPADGIRKLMETVGLGGAMSTPERDKFRIRLEKTTNGTEIYFSHRGMYETFINEGKSDTMWQPRPVDPNLEAELLGRFMIRMGITEEKAKEALKQTQTVADKPKEAIVDGKLNINDSFDRAWRRVGLALDRIGLVVNDRDRSQGIYYVKPAKGELDKNDNSSSGGFWSSLAFWKSKDTEDKSSNPTGPEYRILVKDVGNGLSTLAVQDKQGKQLSDSFAKSVLSKLQTELQ
ncbi:outer membrane protein assembly factor BamC [Aquitalea aquatica]|uniref:Outer membrane protein assembly factor BamC n=1 Tax=Aquitalea aquatica TaxID=3044273 RepID=A0A838XVH0_9NEIS|nr:outer membrane protein assembly factor BamC [Aquitalea magnusonii]MBA4707140.1 outer membrane protein assembly factor BamC [Aquitalea magnusonii]